MNRLPRSRARRSADHSARRRISIAVLAAAAAAFTGLTGTTIRGAAAETTPIPTVTTVDVPAQMDSGHSTSIWMYTRAADGFSGTPSGVCRIVIDGVESARDALTNGACGDNPFIDGAGPHHISVFFDGNEQWAGSGAHATINALAWVSVTVNVSMSSVTTDETVTVSAHVAETEAHNMGAPTGTIAFVAGSKELGTVGLDQNADASLVTKLPANADSVSALYSGDAWHESAGGSVGDIDVVGKPSVTLITAGPTQPVHAQEPVDVSASVAAVNESDQLPTGYVAFLAEGVGEIGWISVTDGKAAGQITFPYEGEFQLSARYEGDEVFEQSISPSVPITVQAARQETETAFSVMPARITAGASATLTATVTLPSTTPTPTDTNTDGNAPLATPSQPQPESSSTPPVATRLPNVSTPARPLAGTPDAVTSGRVEFIVNGTVVNPGGTELNAQGTATLKHTLQAPGSYDLIARYVGTDVYRPSASDTQTLQVLPATLRAVDISLTTQPSPIQVGHSATVTATVRSHTAGQTTPTGNVTFTIDGKQLAVSPIKGQGKATATVTDLTAGQHSLAAAYSGDSGYAKRTTTISLTVKATVLARVNAGGAAASGWSADTAGRPSRMVNTGSRIQSTSHWVVNGIGVPEAVLQSARWDPASPPEMTWLFPAANGTVRLLFAETSQAQMKKGARLFDVRIESSEVLHRFDVYAAAGGGNRGVSRTFIATVKDNSLSIGFRHEVGHPMISGIEILRVG